MILHRSGSPCLILTVTSNRTERTERYLAKPTESGPWLHAGWHLKNSPGVGEGNIGGVTVAGYNRRSSLLRFARRNGSVEVRFVTCCCYCCCCCCYFAWCCCASEGGKNLWLLLCRRRWFFFLPVWRCFGTWNTVLQVLDEDYHCVDFVVPTSLDNLFCN